MKKLVLLAAAAGALALPAAPASADCTDVVAGVGNVQTCQRRTYDRTYVTYRCSVDAAVDGYLAPVCQPGFEIVLEG